MKKMRLPVELGAERRRLSWAPEPAARVGAAPPRVSAAAGSAGTRPRVSPAPGAARASTGASTGSSKSAWLS